MSRVTFPARCREIAARLHVNPPGRTPSLIATLFGDVVEAYGGEIWLGSLSRLLAPFGISERLVRTSVHRLAKEGFLEATRLGRRSFYRLSRSALDQVERFEQRIYYFREPPWDGKWRLIFTGTRGVSSGQRAELRKQLNWLGFGTIAPNVYGHPSASLEPVDQLFRELKIADQVVIMLATNHHQIHGLGTQEMIRQCFDITGLEQRYQTFNNRYRPLADSPEDCCQIADVDPEHAFVVRTLLIHEYRRILLYDPGVPARLLPDGWSGIEAQRLCAKLYQALAPPSDRYIRDWGANRHGPFQVADRRHSGRFQT
ncbi:MAG: phenylacetic acid degradation operon negative regulatory protein PaaX [Gammaproteobacteria bacterium]|nr:phenylacetic acid degradation operon negative regulatory protein PaaX [Gammaproteobacteria bacterium]